MSAITLDGRTARVLDVTAELLGRRDELLARARTLAPAPRGRAWVRVLDTADADAWLITWDPAGRVAAHDHGGSRGAVHVLRGTLTESYRADPDDHDERVRRLRRGTTIAIPDHHVHEIANLGAGRAYSLHVYSPRLTSMTFYPTDPPVPD